MTPLNEFRLNDYIQHMLQAIQRIEEYTEEHAEDYFLKTPILQDAVVRNIEILGEASHNLLKRFITCATVSFTAMFQLIINWSGLWSARICPIFKSN
jgi:uncharacterized protein with HEPN domain